MFFWIAASAADIPDDKPHEIKTLLATGVSTLFINYKPTITDGIRKFGNGPYWLAIFLVVPFNEIPLFSKDLITYIISLLSSFFRVIPEPATDELQLWIFLPIILNLASTRISLLNDILVN